MTRIAVSILLAALACVSCSQAKQVAGGPAGTALDGPSATPMKAPDMFKVEFETTKGNFTVQVVRAWAPSGVDRFYELVSKGFYQDIAIFRVIEGFVAQFGLHGDPKVTAKWQNSTIQDDSVEKGNKRGTISFASRGPNTRTTQLFINYKHNKPLDAQGFSPFAQVTQGMEVVDSFHKPPKVPNQGVMTAQGNAYLKAQFPDLDYIKTAKILK